MNTDNEKYNSKITTESAFINELKRKIPEFFTKDGQFDIDKFKSQLQKNNVNELSNGYQLSFIGKDYARRQSGEMPNSVIVPNKKYNDDYAKNSENLFFTGDNLEVLRHLQNNYYNKIDAIYIDPPYNTGNNDFVYPDSFEYSDDKLKEMFDLDDEGISHLKSIQGKSSHSAWLTFMYPRLFLAKKLISDNGCIMVSIDENEDSNLREIMDEIYGEVNYVGQIIRKTRSAVNDPAAGFNQQNELLYVYAKNIYNFSFHGEKKETKSYSNPDNDPMGKWTSDNPSAKSGSEGTYFEIKNPYTGKVDLPPAGRYWAFSKKTMEQWVKNGKLVFKRDYKENERGFFIKKYLNDLKSNYKQVDSLFGAKNEYMNQSATKYLRDEIFDGLSLFSSPKPVNFIEKLIKYTTNKNSIVLDFFAGSATTAEAVYRLNATDDGNRKFIMVQLPEKTYTYDSKGNEVPTKGGKVSYDAGFKTIDEISRNRIYRSFKKMKNDKNLNFSDSFDGSFKHYWVVKPNTRTLEDIDDFDPDNTSLFSEMLNNFSGAQLNVEGNASGKDTILNTWIARDGYPFDVNVKKIYLDNKYEADLIDNNRLYLINEGWNSNYTKDLLNKLGSYEMNIQTIIIFGYSFNITNLRELEIGLKQLDINISFLKRY